MQAWTAAAATSNLRVADNSTVARHFPANDLYRCDGAVQKA
jgi:hypothetical protein